MPKKPKQVEGVYEKNPGSGVWYTRLRVQGKLVRKAIGTRAEAVAYIEKARTLRRTGEGVVPQTAKRPARSFSEIELTGAVTSVAELCDLYLAHIQDEHNPDRPRDQVNPPHRIAAIRQVFGSRPASEVKPYEVTDWLKGLRRQPATLNRYKSTFSAIYQFGKSRELVSTNPVREVQQFRVATPLPRFMDHEEERRIRTVIQRWIDTCPLQYRLTRLKLREHLNEITVAVGTGMRKGNQYGLRWTNVDLRHRLIHLPMTKPGTSHSIPIIDDVYEALSDQQSLQCEIAELVKKQGNLATKLRMVPDGRVFTIRENREWFAKACKEAKVKNLRWHDLGRHTTGSRLAQAGANLKVIQEVLGHATVSMAARYSHLNKAHLAESMKSLNRLE